jgi:hypothetical protein
MEPGTVKALVSLLSHIKVHYPLLSLGDLAAGYADWISDGNNASNQLTCKVGILCSSMFQKVAGQWLGDEFVVYFRLLLWTTTHFYPRMREDKHISDIRTNPVVLKNLVLVINACGKKVVQRLNRLCLPARIKDMNGDDRKRLFLLLLGMCQSVSYLAEESEDYLVRFLCV